MFSALPAMFEQAVSALAARDEPIEENPYRAAAIPRVFGPAPGSYGSGVVEAVTDLTDITLDDAGEAWLEVQKSDRFVRRNLTKARGSSL